MTIEKIHTITNSEYGRGYIYLTANKRDNPWIGDLTPGVIFFGKDLGTKKLNRGRVIIGKINMQLLAKPGINVKISICASSNQVNISEMHSTGK